MANTIPITSHGADQLGTEMVTIHVGPRRKAFIVHKKLITSHSAFFANALRNSSSSSSATSFPTGSPDLYLEEDDDTSFESFIDYLYRDAIPAFPATQIPSTPNPTRHLQHLFILAEKYCLPSLCNRVMDALQDNNLLHHARPSAHQMRAIYANTSPKSKLRTYCVAMFSRDLVRARDEATVNKFMALIEEIEDLAVDVVRFQQGFGKRLFQTPILEPRDREGVMGLGKCFFHTHGKGICHTDGDETVVP